MGTILHFFTRLWRRKTLYIHIGTHKTGTTSIQHFIRSKANTLAEDGILVPTSGTLDGLSGHHNLAWDLTGDMRAEKNLGNLQSLLHEIKSSPLPKAVISAEDLEFLVRLPATLKAISEAFRTANIKPIYVVYFRGKSSYMQSLHEELGKHGLQISFAEFHAFLQRDNSFAMNGHWYFDFDSERFTRKWQEFTGARLKTLSYDQAAEKNDLLPSFLSAIGASRKTVELSRTSPKLNVGRREFAKAEYS